MGIKLEYILTIIFISIVFFTTTIKLTSSATLHQHATKELEFFSTTFIEVDTQKKQAQLYTPHGVRESGILILDKINYYTPTIDSLLANKGTYQNDILHLDGHVSLKETVGNIYKTEHAVYDQKKEILTITSPFVAYMGANIFRGETLIYDAVHKEANATKIDAIVYPAKK